MLWTTRVVSPVWPSVSHAAILPIAPPRSLAAAHTARRPRTVAAMACAYSPIATSEITDRPRETSSTWAVRP